MCVIYACSTSLPPEEELRRGAFQNDDGGGIAYLRPDSKGNKRVFWSKGFKDEKDVLKHIHEEKVPFPLAIHFRTASVGDPLPELCHPFPIDSSAPEWLEGWADQVLFHNGHIPNWSELLLQKVMASKNIQVPDGEWSDSRAIAWLTSFHGWNLLPFIIDKSRVLIMHSEAMVLKDKDYDPGLDHFTFLGDWHTEQGWRQSIKTDYRSYTRGGTTVIDLSEESAEDHRWSYSATPKTDMEIVWTIGELDQIIKELGEQIEDARTSAGL